MSKDSDNAIAAAALFVCTMILVLFPPTIPAIDWKRVGYWILVLAISGVGITLLTFAALLLVWWRYKVPGIRKIKTNDWGGKKCSECSVKHRPKWADWPWPKLFWAWVQGVYPFFRLPPGTPMSPVAYVPSTETIEKWAEEGRLGQLFDDDDTCDHIRQDQVEAGVREKILKAALGT